MGLYLLKNDQLLVEIKSDGAELTSIKDINTGVQYLWNADSTYWKRHAPILFPFVGLPKNKTYTYKGIAYTSGQHGFARDMNFEMLHTSDEEVWFRLDATEATRSIYPFDFRLELGYRLENRTINCYWRVINRGTDTMHFSIGGHPAFYCPIDKVSQQSDYSLSFDTEKPIRYLGIDENGSVDRTEHILTPDHGILPLNPHMFDHDALIIEDHQCHQVSLLDPSKQPYLTVRFDAPLFGLWSPAKMNAPFVCIEPWYGRSDAADFTGSLEDREYGNSLDAGQIFEKSYSIEVI